MTDLIIRFTDGTEEIHTMGKANEDTSAFDVGDQFINIEDLEGRCVFYNIDTVKSIEIKNR